MANRDRPPRVLDRATALQRGMSRHQIDRRLRTGTWRRLLPGVFLTADTLTWNDRITAALLHAGPRSVLTAAAALDASDIRVARPARITVLVPPSCRSIGADWVRLRRTERVPGPLRWFGPRRAPVERAIVDFALEQTDLDTVRTALARTIRSGWCRLDDVAAELALAQRNGSALLRQALMEVTAGAASAPEARAAAILRRARLGGFEQNARIDTPDGHRVADFLWRDRRAILEIDSVEHHLDPADWRATMDRQLELESLGYSVIHRPPSALTDPVRFAADVRRWLAGRPRWGDGPAT